MFAVCRDPLPLSEACLHGLCASLNAPVVRSDELPPGPARAAIVVYAEDYGDLAVAVGMRALESGQVAVYRCREPLHDAADVARVKEEALAFAESLGFLFDEDMIDASTGAGRSEALEHWLRLTGDGEIFSPGSVAEPPAPPVAELTLPGEGLDAPMEDLLASPDGSGSGRRADASELLLDDLMDSMGKSADDDLLLPDDGDAAFDDDFLLDDEGDEPLDDAGPETVVAPAARERAAVPLSKFRTAGRSTAEAGPPPRGAARAADRPAASRADAVSREKPAASAPVADDEAAAGGAALGRIPIVRRRKGAEAPRPGILARLLASF